MRATHQKSIARARFVSQVHVFRGAVCDKLWLAFNLFIFVFRRVPCATIVANIGCSGGGIVLGPLVSERIAAATEQPVGAPHRFAGGLLAGAACGLGTQLFHNTALTAGRMAATGPQPGPLVCLRAATSTLFWNRLPCAAPPPPHTRAVCCAVL